MNVRKDRGNTSQWIYALLCCFFVLPTIISKANTEISAPLNYVRWFKNGVKKQAKDSISVAGLPITEFPVKSNKDTMAVVLSGDGGWRPLVNNLAAYLNKKQIPVIGLDTREDFHEERRPKQFSKQLKSIYYFYRKKWHKKHIIFIGYSMGADVLPFGINRLPWNVKKRIAKIVLIAPSQSTTFKLRWINYIFPAREEQKTLPQVKKLKKKKLFIICDDLSYSLCNVIKKDKFNIVHLEGGHHFNNDYATLDHIVGQHLKIEP